MAASSAIRIRSSSRPGATKVPNPERSVKCPRSPSVGTRSSTWKWGPASISRGKELAGTEDRRRLEGRLRQGGGCADSETHPQRGHHGEGCADHARDTSRACHDVPPMRHRRLRCAGAVPPARPATICRGPRRSSPSPPSGQMTVKTIRLSQPETPTVYSPRWTPPTHGPRMGGWTTSFESTVPVAVGQLISNCPRVTAVWTAIDCLLSRNWAGVAHPPRSSLCRPPRLPTTST